MSMYGFLWETSLGPNRIHQHLQAGKKWPDMAQVRHPKTNKSVKPNPIFWTCSERYTPAKCYKFKFTYIKMQILFFGFWITIGFASENTHVFTSLPTKTSCGFFSMDPMEFIFEFYIFLTALQNYNPHTAEKATPWLPTACVRFGRWWNSVATSGSEVWICVFVLGFWSFVCMVVYM